MSGYIPLAFSENVPRNAMSQHNRRKGKRGRYIRTTKKPPPRLKGGGRGGWRKDSLWHGKENTRLAFPKQVKKVASFFAAECTKRESGGERLEERDDEDEN